MRLPSASLKLLLGVTAALALTVVPIGHAAGMGSFPLPRAPTSGLAIFDQPVCTPVAPVDLVRVSDGTAVGPADIAAFDGKWMTPDVCTSELQAAEDAHKIRKHGWAATERMAAMVNMFELTHDERYLKHLRQFIELALRYRDDRYPGNAGAGERACQRCEPTPIDDYRGGHVAGWGTVQGTILPSGRSCPGNLCSGLEEVVTSMYAYPIAAFARIVAEDTSLQAAYGADAVRYANAALETMRALMPQMDFQAGRNFIEGYLTDVTYPASFGKAMEYNVNAAFIMMLMELRRALDSPFYRQSAPQPPDVDLVRTLIPFLVSRFQRYFAFHLQTWFDTPDGSPRFHWNYGDGTPDAQRPEYYKSFIEMRYIDVLRRNFDRLNAQVEPAGEPIAFGPSYLERFANTFVYKIAEVPWAYGGSNLAQTVDGDNRGSDQNLNCKGWVNLAVADPRVYSICRDVTVRLINGGGPFSLGAHSEVLMNKQFYRVPDPGRDHEPHCGPHPC